MDKATESESSFDARRAERVMEMLLQQHRSYPTRLQVGQFFERDTDEKIAGMSLSDLYRLAKNYPFFEPLSTASISTDDRQLMLRYVDNEYVGTSEDLNSMTERFVRITPREITIAQFGRFERVIYCMKVGPRGLTITRVLGSAMVDSPFHLKTTLQQFLEDWDSTLNEFDVRELLRTYVRPEKQPASLDVSVIAEYFDQLYEIKREGKFYHSELYAWALKFFRYINTEPDSAEKAANTFVSIAPSNR